MGISVNKLLAVSAEGATTAHDSISTIVMMKSGETAAIGGLIQNTRTTGYGDGNPGANAIINLSRSKSFNKNKSQFVVFLTPEIIKSASEGSKKMKEKFRIE